MRTFATFRLARRAPFLQVAKSAIATISAWLVAGWLVDGPPPVFAAIAALLVVQPSLNQSFTRAIERSVGVIAGVVVASALGLTIGDDTPVVLLATAVALLVAWALKLTPGTANQVAISAVLVLALGTTTPNYALDRIIETLIGALLGLVVNLVLVPPVAVAPAREKVEALGLEIGRALDRLADALESPQNRQSLETLLLEARLLRPMVSSAHDAIDGAAESLALNPRSLRHRDDLARVNALLEAFTPVTTQVIGMTRTCYDRYDPTIANEPAVRAIAEQLRRAAHDIGLVVAPARNGTASGTPAPTTDEPPALTRPLQLTTPSSDHWILVGSLLTDLNRMHESIGETTGRRPS